jgi:transposase InsO family protein
VFSDSDRIPSKPKNFDCDFYLQSKSIHKLPKTLQDHVKSKFDIIYSDVHRPLAIQSGGGKRYFVTFIDEFSQYIWIYFVRHKSDVKTVFLTFYNLVETQFSAKIKKLKPNNGGEYVNKEMTAFLEIKGIIHNLSTPYAHESNGLPECMNRTIVMMVRSITLDYADVISQALWAEVCSPAIHIKNRLLHSAFKFEKLPYKIMFTDKPSIKHCYPFGAKCYVHVLVEIQIGIFKLSPKAIRC